MKPSVNVGIRVHCFFNLSTIIHSISADFVLRKKYFIIQRVNFRILTLFTNDQDFALSGEKISLQNPEFSGQMKEYKVKD